MALKIGMDVHIVLSNILDDKRMNEVCNFIALYFFLFIIIT